MRKIRVKRRLDEDAIDEKEVTAGDYLDKTLSLSNIDYERLDENQFAIYQPGSSSPGVVVIVHQAAYGRGRDLHFV